MIDNNSISSDFSFPHLQNFHIRPKQDKILVISFILSLIIMMGLVSVEFYNAMPLINIFALLLAEVLILSTNWNIALLALCVVSFLPSLRFNELLSITGLTAPNIVCATVIIRLMIENKKSLKYPWPWQHPLWKRVFISYVLLMLIRCFGYIRSDEVILAFRLGSGYLRGIIVFMATFRALNKGVSPRNILYMASFLCLPICFIIIFSGTTALQISNDYKYIRYSFPFDANGACFIADLLWISAFSVVLTVKNISHRILGLAFMAFSGAAILFTFSRGGQITFLIGTLLLPFALKKKQALFMGIAPLVISFILWWPSLFLARWKHTFENPDEVVSVYDTGSRAQTIVSTWEIAKSNLLFGLGGRRYMDVARETYGYYFRTHNHYVELIAEAGLIALGIYLSLIYFLLRNFILIWPYLRSYDYLVPFGVLIVWFIMMLIFNFGGGLSFAMERTVPIIMMISSIAFHYFVQGEASSKKFLTYSKN